MNSLNSGYWGVTVSPNGWFCLPWGGRGLANPSRHVWGFLCPDAPHEMRVRCPVLTENFKPQHGFLGVRVIAISSCVSCVCLLKADMTGGTRAARIQVCASPASRCLPHSWLHPPELKRIPTKTKGGPGCCVHPSEWSSQEYLLYFVIGADLNKSYLEQGKVVVLTHYRSRTRLCGLVQPVLSFRNQKPRPVQN